MTVGGMGFIPERLLMMMMMIYSIISLINRSWGQPLSCSSQVHAADAQSCAYLSWAHGTLVPAAKHPTHTLHAWTAPAAPKQENTREKRGPEGVYGHET